MMNTVLSLIEAKKVCKGYKVEKALGEFHRRSDGGLQTNCKPCRNKEYRNARGNDADKRKTVTTSENGRTCLTCKKEKSWDNFHTDIHGFNGKTARCRDCRNENYKDPRSGTNKGRPDRVKRSYGVTYEHVVQTLNDQHGLCANRACGKEISLDVALSSNRAVIDHCHATGKFRAVLCQPCNLLLGSVETKQNLMLGLVEYLSKYRFN